MTEQLYFPATAMPDSDWWHTLWPDPREILDRVGIRAGMNVVDLCCGNGHFTRPMCELVAPGQAWALDLDEGLLAETEKLCGHYDNFHSILSDARDIADQFAETVDYIFIANTFHGIPDKAEISKSVFRALNKGGRFAIINWHNQPREQTTVLGVPRGPDTHLRMPPEEVEMLVTPAGFRLDTLIDVTPYHYAAIFNKL